MSSMLSENNIMYAENFIEKNNYSDGFPSISEYDREKTIEYWKLINDKNTPCTSYFQFSENALGMVSYGFYKTKKGEIYILSAYCNKLTNYYKVDEDWYMLN